MRNREVIEREMYKAREDLESSLAELKHVVAETVDVKARARVAVAKGKMAAYDALEDGKAVAIDALQRGKHAAVDALVRGKTASKDFAVRGKDGAVDAFNAAKDRPVLVAGIVGGIVAVGVLAYVGRQKQWW